MLAEYITQSRALLQVILPNPATNLYSDALLKTNINLARKRLAGEAEAVRIYGALPIDDTSNVYPFSDIDTGNAVTTGVDSVFVVRQGSIVVADGQTALYTRGWPWFQTYCLNEIISTTGQPSVYAQYAQGSSGSLYFWPRPGTGETYTVNLDCVCVPVDLADDTTVEAIPFPFTLCVPFLACYYTLQSPQRQADAELMLKRYKEYLDQARTMSNPSVLPFQAPQSSDPTTQNKLGLPSGGRPQ